MTKHELYQHLRRIAMDGERIVLTRHTRWERMKPRSISMDMIAQVLQYGTMPRAPKPGKYENEIKCRFERRDKDRRRIGVEVAVADSEPDLIVITVIRYSD